MKVLILPIGPPGVGKTYIGKYIKNKLGNKSLYLSRDDIYHNFRKTNSIRKSKQLTHHHIKTELIIAKKMENIIVYIDTTNSNKGIRDLYISYLCPDIFKYICFIANNIDILLLRTKNREHPTFPKDNINQLNTINKIHSSIEYPYDINNSLYIYI